MCGSREWLQTWLPVIRRAVNFLPLEPISGLDGGLLIYAPGSLMIDTFRREGFTTDTNVLMVHVLRQMARAEVRMGGSSRAMEQLARNVSDAVNALLWHTSDGDHYVTSVVRESRAASGERASSRSSSRVAPQATRVVDFVDSDSNLMAVALGVSSGPRARHILERIDRNPLARFVPTWVSERLYEGDDSRPPGGTADSICGMGRIAYFNALARRRIGSPASRRFFLDHLLGKIVRDLEQLVWMPGDACASPVIPCMRACFLSAPSFPRCPSLPICYACSLLSSLDHAHALILRGLPLAPLRPPPPPPPLTPLGINLTRSHLLHEQSDTGRPVNRRQTVRRTTLSTRRSSLSWSSR